MRLRLRIERNALPPTQAIWPVKETKSTISQLLQHVNDVFPLEGETWGLEDYSVTVGGYECLHYHELSAVCRDEDEVIIQPLAHVDVRARTLAGRSQIAADGRHLVDGVPFGRPCLKGPIRPDIRIPPRKKKKLLEDGEDALDQLMITQAGEPMDGDEHDELDDEDFEENDSDVSTSNGGSSESESDDSESSSDSRSDSDSSSGDLDSESESESDEESWSGIPGSNQTTPQSKAGSGLLNGTVPDGSPSPMAGTKRKRGHEAENFDVEIIVETLGDQSSLPEQGRSSTRQRNQRRRDSKKLKHLKALNVLPSDADFLAMRQWSESDSILDREEEFNDGAYNSTGGSLSGDVVSTSIGKALKRLRADSESESEPALPSTSAESPAQVSPDQPILAADTKKSKKRRKGATKDAETTTNQFEAQRQKLLADIASGGVELNAINDDGPPEELSSKMIVRIVGAEDQGTDVGGDIAKTDISKDEEVPVRRVQLDIASSKRLLFGSLGVRVPKTQEEKDRIQKKLAGRPKRNANVVNQEDAGANTGTVNGITDGGVTPTEASDVEKDPGAWYERINLTATECCDEEVYLSTPPFPFYQRWDPQYNKKKKRNSSKYSSQGGSKYIETYDKYNINPEGDALDYDDAVAGDEYWEDGALLGDDEGPEAGSESAADQDNGFPAIPATLASLERLAFNNAQKGDFIAFTELACDEKTDWQPSMVTRTAKILEAPTDAANNARNADEPWVIQLAQRDLKTKVFNEEGNRVYSKFDMPGTDAEDEGRREVSWTQLGEVKLVLRPEVHVSTDQV